MTFNQQVVVNIIRDNIKIDSTWRHRCGKDCKYYDEGAKRRCLLFCKDLMVEFDEGNIRRAFRNHECREFIPQ